MPRGCDSAVACRFVASPCIPMPTLRTSTTCVPSPNPRIWAVATPAESYLRHRQGCSTPPRRQRCRRGAPRLRLPVREPEDFARGRALTAGLVWVGPTAGVDASAMGAQGRGEAADRSSCGGTAGAGCGTRRQRPSTPDELADAAMADRIGYPLLVKAIRGWRRQRACASFDKIPASSSMPRSPRARREAASSASAIDDGLPRKATCEQSRHVEVQVFGDDARRLSCMAVRAGVLDPAPAPERCVEEVAVARHATSATLERMYEAALARWPGPIEVRGRRHGRVPGRAARGRRAGASSSLR